MEKIVKAMDLVRREATAGRSRQEEVLEDLVVGRTEDIPNRNPEGLGNGGEAGTHARLLG